MGRVGRACVFLILLNYPKIYKAELLDAFILPSLLMVWAVKKDD